MNARVSDEELVRYYDGELSPLEAERVERLLRDDPRGERVLDGLEQLGDVMRAWADRRAASQGDLVAGVMARIAEDGAKPTSRVIPLQPAAGPARRLRRAAVVITGTLSLAAAAALVLRFGQPAPHASAPPRAVAVHSAAALPVEQPVTVAEESEGDPAAGDPAAIQTVDFGAHAGSIFVVAGTEGDVPVVWLLDDVADPRARMQPL